MRVLHIIHRSVPGTHGYAIRSRQIVNTLKAKGLEPLVLTSPSQAPLGELDGERSEYIDGVRYFRSCSNLLPPTKEVKDDSAFRSALRVAQNTTMLFMALRIVRKYKPAVIHAHSPFTCGLVGDTVGRITGTPVIYEVRGIWEGSHAARRKAAEKMVRYRAVRLFENIALRGATRVCAIGESLADEVASRGIPRESMLIVPNGVNVTTFKPGDPSPELRAKLNLNDAIVTGYIGSFFTFEGLDLMVEAMGKLADEFPKLKLLFVGGGELRKTLESMAAERGIADRIIFTGRVPHEEVPEYYRLCDIFILPRRDAERLRFVTPLKPMEIMAMQKPVIASNIDSHKEMVIDGENGLLFQRDNADDLADTWRKLLQSEELRHDIGRRARKWVEQNRDWMVLADRYVDAYAEYQ